MTRTMLGCFASCLLLALWTPDARGDGGVVRISRQQGDCRITVFTSPTPLRAGAVDVSVLAQDAATGETLRDAQIEVQAWRRGRSEAAIRQQATSQAATNKLFQAAQFELPEPGRWEFLVTVTCEKRTEQVQFAAEAADKLPPWQTMWPWFTWPVVVICLFAVRRANTPSMLVLRQHRKLG